MKRPWYESDNPTTVVRSGMWRTGVVVLAVGAFVLAVSAVLWGLGVLTSDPKGRGDAIRNRNSAANRVAAQERFQVLYNEVLAADKRIGVAYTAVQGDLTNQTLMTNYTGAVNYCFTVVADYDATTQKFSAEVFRDTDLPEFIDPLDPLTDCDVS